MKNLSYSIIFIVALSLLACSSKEAQDTTETVSEETVNIPLGDNSQVSLDWNGTYTGTIPCADCEGIQVDLTLNSDETYILKTQYLGRNDDLQQEMTGPFVWDESGSTITLQNLEGMPGKYKVGENRLWHLDMDGQVITGDLADLYILQKQ
ncbi:copper resistance protein NlpE [Algoriphagus namhaensis]